MHSLQPQQNAQLRPRGHDENILEEAYRGRYARQRLLNFWPESSCGYHAIKRFVCIIQVPKNRQIGVVSTRLGRMNSVRSLFKGNRSPLAFFKIKLGTLLKTVHAQKLENASYLLGKRRVFRPIVNRPAFLTSRIKPS